MRRDHLLVFDDIISAGASAAQVYTTATLNQRLAANNEFGYQVVIDNVSGTPAFDLWVEHSPDGRTWLQHSDSSQTFPPTESAGNGDISFSSGSLVANTTYTRMYSNVVLGQGKVGSSTTGPLLSNARLSMKLSTGEAHVKVYGVFRDP